MITFTNQSQLPLNNTNTITMIQIKLFMDKTPYMEKFESQVNKFLEENDGKIIVNDIKYTAETPNPGNSSVWKAWTAMVIYEVK